jgi:hypothetical protein
MRTICAYFALLFYSPCLFSGAGGSSPLPNYTIDFLTHLDIHMTQRDCSMPEAEAVHMAIKSKGMNQVFEKARNSKIRGTQEPYFKIINEDWGYSVEKKYPLRDAYIIIKIAFFCENKNEFTDVLYLEEIPVEGDTRPLPQYMVEFLAHLGIHVTQRDRSVSESYLIQEIIKTKGIKNVFEMAKKAKIEGTQASYFGIKKTEFGYAVGKKYPLKNTYLTMIVYFHCNDSGMFSEVSYMQEISDFP